MSGVGLGEGVWRGSWVKSGGWAAALQVDRDSRLVCGAGFVDEGAKVAFGVAAAGVEADVVFFGDYVEEFFDGAALRGLFVEFELRSQAA